MGPKAAASTAATGSEANSGYTLGTVAALTKLKGVEKEVDTLVETGQDVLGQMKINEALQKIQGKLIPTTRKGYSTELGEWQVLKKGMVEPGQIVFVRDLVLWSDTAEMNGGSTKYKVAAPRGFVFDGQHLFLVIGFDGRRNGQLIGYPGHSSSGNAVYRLTRQDADDVVVVMDEFDMIPPNVQMAGIVVIRVKGYGKGQFTVFELGKCRAMSEGVVTTWSISNAEMKVLSALAACRPGQAFETTLAQAMETDSAMLAAIALSIQQGAIRKDRTMPARIASWVSGLLKHFSTPFRANRASIPAGYMPVSPHQIPGFGPGNSSATGPNHAPAAKRKRSPEDEGDDSNAPVSKKPCNPAPASAPSAPKSMQNRSDATSGRRRKGGMTSLASKMDKLSSKTTSPTTTARPGHGVAQKENSLSPRNVDVAASGYGAIGANSHLQQECEDVEDRFRRRREALVRASFKPDEHVRSAAFQTAHVDSTAQVSQLSPKTARLKEDIKLILKTKAGDFAGMIKGGQGEGGGKLKGDN